MGSQAYGTATPNSDIDIKGIYIQNIYDVASFKYQQQIMPDKDTTYFEVKRFLELAGSANPTILELMWMPDRCIQIKDPLYTKYIESNRDIFLTKECCNSFMGYAYQQIYKAKGLNKKMNWEADRITRKKPIDFCKFLWLEQQPNHDISLEHWYWKNNIPENGNDYFYVLSKIDNTKQLYKLWYVEGLQEACSWYHGLCNNNDLLTPPIPKDIFNDYTTNLKAIVQYDLDGFQAHCREYNQYQTWLKERNEQRYVDVQNHGQKIDGKNLMHCYRLIDMAEEIVKEHKIIVERPNKQELLDIRHGKYDLQTLIDRAEEKIEIIKELYKNSDLPDKVDKEKVNEILVNIRKENEQN